MSKGKDKGTAFEREVCKQLSLWWSEGGTDDIFWRTAGSGARAKVRSKVDRGTFGQHGDIQATDPQGQPLIDLCTIELKRGYSTKSFADMLDRLPHHKQQPYGKFIQQAKEDCENAGAYAWMVIVKRNQRNTLICIPTYFFRKLKEAGTEIEKSNPACYMKVVILEPKSKKHFKFIKQRMFITTLDEFLSYVQPYDITQIWKNRCRVKLIEEQRCQKKSREKRK